MLEQPYVLGPDAEFIVADQAGIGFPAELAVLAGINRLVQPRLDHLGGIFKIFEELVFW